MTTRLDVADLRSDLLLAQVDAYRMIAAARASVAAQLRGDPNPLAWIEAELDRRGLLPAADADPLQVIAEPAPRGLFGVPHHGLLQRLRGLWKTWAANRAVSRQPTCSPQAATPRVRPRQDTTGSGTQCSKQRAQATRGMTGPTGDLIGRTDLP